MRIDAAHEFRGQVRFKANMSTRRINRVDWFFRDEAEPERALSKVEFRPRPAR
jgi:hypothetical protein